MIQVDDEVFKDWLLDRAGEFSPATNYPPSFWEEVVDFLFETKSFSNPQYNDPKYIIDNIAVNGEILNEEELKNNNLIGINETIDDYCGDGIRFDDYIVINFGF